MYKDYKKNSRKYDCARYQVDFNNEVLISITGELRKENEHNWQFC